MIAYDKQITAKVSKYGYDLGVKGQVQIYFNTVLGLVTQTPFSFFDVGSHI